MPRVIRSPAARRDLKRIYGYIARRSGKERARAVLQNIAGKMELHATMPEGAQARDELHEGLRSFSVYDYVVFYVPIPDGIDIKRVLHGAQDISDTHFESIQDPDEQP